jgi:hypothetical protein
MRHEAAVRGAASPAAQSSDHAVFPSHPYMHEDSSFQWNEPAYPFM